MATATPTEQTQITSTIPKYAEPYAQQLLGSVFGGVDPTSGQFIPGLIGQGYEPYKGQTVAGFNPLQQQAIESTAGMRAAPQLSEATGLAMLAGRRAGELGAYAPMRAGRGYQSPFEQADGLGRYMSPYIQSVIEAQKQGAARDYMRQLPGMGAAAARAGARGGTREALMQSEARRSLSERLGDIEATGLQQAYQQATQQAMQDAATRAQYGLAGRQLAEQSRQFGAGLGLQGLQTALSAAQGLGQLGQQQYQQNMGINALQNQYGLQQQAQMQKDLDTKYQDYLNYQNYPYKQLGFMSDLLRGSANLAGTGGKTVYEAQPSQLSQMVGPGLLGLGIYREFMK